MTRFVVRMAGEEDIEAWAALRHQLWPELDVEGHRAEILEALMEPDRLVAFFCLDSAGLSMAARPRQLPFWKALSLLRSPAARG